MDTSTGRITDASAATRSGLSESHLLVAWRKGPNKHGVEVRLLESRLVHVFPVTPWNNAKSWRRFQQACDLGTKSQPEQFQLVGC